MTAPMLMTDCPTEETLAAYIDDRLDAATRLEVTTHVASCGECRELVNMAADFQASETPARVVRGKFGWLATAAALAAAAALTIFVLKPEFVYGPRVDDVIAASRSLDYRPGLGRIAGEFPYKEKLPTKRGSPTSSDPTNLEKSSGLAAKAELYRIADEARNSHVRGLAHLLTATSGEEFQQAIAELTTAYDKASGSERDAIALDLAAALLAYAQWTGDRGAAERALQLADDLWKREHSLEAAWNRAAALEELGRNDEAIRAWTEYLRLDPTSSWAEEAEKSKKGLHADP